MAILPEGFALPPPAYLVVLVCAVGAVAMALYRVDPAVTEGTVLALAPWMGVGSSLYVLYQVGAIPEIVAPFFGSPAVYGSAFVAAGSLWVAAIVVVSDDAAGREDSEGVDTAPGSVTKIVGGAGSLVALAIVGGALWIGVRRGSVLVVWPSVGLVVAALVAAGTWTIVRRSGLSETGWAGALVVFGHALDGVSTAVGIDVLGFGEQTPLARAVLEVTAGLSVADVLGTGWLFVLLKVVLAVVVVWLLADSVRERPREGYLLLALVAAIGLGPGVHNLLLFAVAG